MNRILTTTFFSLLSLASMAQRAESITDGFYRVKNYHTNRYAYICGQSGGINIGGSSMQMGAMALFPTVEADAVYGRDRFIDPASVCYVEVIGNFKHNILSQGTSLSKMIDDHYVLIYDAPIRGTYAITPYYKYQKTYNLYDAVDIDDENTNIGCVDAKDNSDCYAKHCWNFYPMDFNSTDGEYLAIAPKEEMKAANGKYYVPYVVGFPMSLIGEGMKAYYVKANQSDAVLIKEYEGDIIPAAMPVIIECSSADPINNRVMLHAPSQNVGNFTDTNLLKGQYFCFEDNGPSAYKQLDKKIMLLTVNADGELTFTNDIAPDDQVHTKHLTFNDGVNEPEIYQCLLSNSSYLTIKSEETVSKPVKLMRDYRLERYKGDVSSIVTDIQQNIKMETKDFNDDGRVTIVDLALYLDYLLKKK